MSIERVFPAITAATARTAAVGADLGARLGRLGLPEAGPLSTQAREAGSTIAAALGRGGEAVVTARLEQAALGFAREARALAIGCPDLPERERDGMVDAALAAGARHVAALPAVRLDDADRIVALLEGAARTLGEVPAPPLHDTHDRPQGV